MLAITIEGEWRPAIGDPTFFGWFTVVCYLGAAFLCWRSALTARRMGNASPSPAQFWQLFAVALLVLGINKQLDLQSWLTVTGKKLAIAQGWYQHRQWVQLAFIACVTAGGLALFAITLRLVKRDWRQYVLVLLGGAFLGSFILIRASSFHHVDGWLGMRLGGFRLNWILELGGIACIGFSAFHNWRKNRRQPGPPRKNQFTFVRPPSMS